MAGGREAPLFGNDPSHALAQSSPRSRSRRCTWPADRCPMALRNSTNRRVYSSVVFAARICRPSLVMRRSRSQSERRSNISRVLMQPRRNIGDSQAVLVFTGRRESGDLEKCRNVVPIGRKKARCLYRAQITRQRDVHNTPSCGGWLGESVAPASSCAA